MLHLLQKCCICIAFVLHFVIFELYLLQNATKMKKLNIQINFPVYRKVLDSSQRIKQVVCIPNEHQVTVTNYSYNDKNVATGESTCHYQFGPNPRFDFRTPLLLKVDCLEISAEDYSSIRTSHAKILN
jgi:hypothetical protein